MTAYTVCRDAGGACCGLMIDGVEVKMVSEARLIHPPQDLPKLVIEIVVLSEDTFGYETK